MKIKIEQIIFKFFAVDKILWPKSPTDSILKSEKSKIQHGKLRNKRDRIKHIINNELKNDTILKMKKHVPKILTGFDELCSMQIVETLPQVLSIKGYAAPTTVKHKSIHQVFLTANRVVLKSVFYKLFANSATR